jgi:Tfp pilus assembly protein PilO
MKLVEIKAIRIFPLEDKPEIRKTELSFQVQGSYINFINFLTKIESSVRIIQVKNISFFSPEEGDLFAFDLGISAYSY